MQELVSLNGQTFICDYTVLRLPCKQFPLSWARYTSFSSFRREKTLLVSLQIRSLDSGLRGVTSILGVSQRLPPTFPNFTLEVTFQSSRVPLITEVTKFCVPSQASELGDQELQGFTVPSGLSRDTMPLIGQLPVIKLGVRLLFGIQSGRTG